MALLEEEKMSEMVDFIGESLREAEAAESNYEDEQQEATEVEVELDSSDASEDVNEEGASPSDTEEDVKEEPGEEQDVVEVEAEDSEPEEKPQQKDSKWVPRDRLNEVNQKWREREQQLLMQMGALNERVNQQSTAPPKEESDDEWMSNLLGDEGGSNVELDKLRNTQQQLVKWQQDFSRQMIFNEFNAELQAAMEKYPGVPEEVFRNAVSRDGSVNMLELGGRLIAERDGLTAKWKAEWDKSNPQAKEEAAPEPDAVRRPSRRSSAAAPPADKPKSYSTVREAGDAMAKEMAEFFDSL